MRLPLSQNGAIVDGLSFILPKREKDYIFHLFDLKSNENKVFIKDDIEIQNVSGKYASIKNNFNFYSKKIDIKPDLELDIHKKSLGGNLILTIKDSDILSEGIPVFKADFLSAQIDKITYPKSFIDFKNITIEASYANIVVKEDKKLYLFSVFDLFSGNKSKNNENNINIDNASLKIKNLNFSDFSLNKKFVININDINCLVKNYPSKVYPEGSIAVSGNINNNNNFNLVGNIGVDTGFKGNFSTRGLLLIDLSPLSERYLGYSLINGLLDVDSSVYVNQDNLNIENNLKLKNLRLKNQNSKIKIDLQEIINLIEDKNKTVELNIPIRGA
ncbi:MAG TPA: DUF748 domain-containing protein, partial [Spirochaetota bacterium]|nr:DUF748 domain-containing protein [Spirochaetota bacterium]